ncbi:MAG: LEA type 2 family protein [Bacteroidota bacterium]
MKHISKSITLLITLAFMLSSCSILDQATEMKTFSKCLFRLDNVQDVVLAGIDVQDVESFGDLSFSEATKLSMTALSGELPLGLTINVEVKNPNPEKASMNELHWILFVDDVEITQGKVDKNVSVPPNGGTAMMPVDIQVDLFEVMSGESADALMNFGLNLAGSGSEPSRIKLKAKPTIYIAMTKMKYPGYITIEEEFVSE